MGTSLPVDAPEIQSPARSPEAIAIEASAPDGLQADVQVAQASTASTAQNDGPSAELPPQEAKAEADRLRGHGDEGSAPDAELTFDANGYVVESLPDGSLPVDAREMQSTAEALEAIAVETAIAVIAPAVQEALPKAEALAQTSTASGTGVGGVGPGAGADDPLTGPGGEGRGRALARSRPGPGGEGRGYMG
jgi:hypothetical protein